MLDRVYTCQNVKLLEISCPGSYCICINMAILYLRYSFHIKKQRKFSLVCCHLSHDVTSGSEVASYISRKSQIPHPRLTVSQICGTFWHVAK